MAALDHLSSLKPKLEELQKEIDVKHAETPKPANFPLRPSVDASLPFSYILGKATSEREIPLVHVEGDGLDTAESSFVTVQALELNVEHEVSNPQGQFNLSIPHKLKKVANYQQMSYSQYLSMIEK